MKNVHAHIQNQGSTKSSWGAETTLDLKGIISVTSEIKMGSNQQAPCGSYHFSPPFSTVYSHHLIEHFFVV